MLGWRIALLLVVLALVAGIWTGNAWHEGRTAIEQNAQLKQQQQADRKAIDDLKGTAQELRQHAVDGALAYQQAAELMEAAAKKLEEDRDAIRQFERRQADALEALAEARPDLRDLRLGDDVLRHWRASNAGHDASEPSPAAAAAPSPGKPAKPVPDAPAAGQRRGAGAARQPRPGCGAVSRLRGADGFAAERGRDLAGHGVAMVLRCSAGDGLVG